MAQIIRLKRNLAGGNKPSTSDLAIGELAMNVHDGKVFLRKSGSAGEGDNIKPIENPLEKINNISGNTFDWNEEKQDIYKGKDYGVVAQEIEKILPELVHTKESGFKSVKYDKIIPLLIEGIKDLNKEVIELKKIIKESK